MFFAACLHEGLHLNPSIVRIPTDFTMTVFYPTCPFKQFYINSFSQNKKKVLKIKIKKDTDTAFLQILGIIYSAMVKPSFYQWAALVL